MKNKMAGGACCLTRYEIIVGTLYIYKRNEICYLKVRVTPFKERYSYFTVKIEYCYPNLQLFLKQKHRTYNRYTNQYTHFGKTYNIYTNQYTHLGKLTTDIQTTHTLWENLQQIYKPIHTLWENLQQIYKQIHTLWEKHKT